MFPRGDCGGLIGGEKVVGAVERFELLRARDRWGFGRCHEATDHVQRRRVLLKTLPTVADSGEVRALWKDLGPHIARLAGTENVSVYDHGWWQGSPFLTTDLPDGVTLGQWIGQHRADRRWAPLKTVRDMLLAVCRGVGPAHRMQVPGPLVHGHLTPESVVVDTSVKGSSPVSLQDFALARLPGAVRGLGEQEAWLDPRSPELCDDPRAFGVGADVFALGVLAVQVLVPNAVEQVRRPFGELREAELRGRLRSLRGDVDATVWDAIEQALHRDLRRRTVDVERFASALRKARWEPGGALLPMATPAPERGRPVAEVKVSALPSALVADVGPLPMHMRPSHPVPREATLVDDAPGEAVMREVSALEAAARASRASMEDVQSSRARSDTVVDPVPSRKREVTHVMTAPAMHEDASGDESWRAVDGAATLPVGLMRGGGPEAIARRSDGTDTLPLGAMVEAAPVVHGGANTLPLGARASVAPVAPLPIVSVGVRASVAPRSPTLGPDVAAAGDDWVGAGAGTGVGVGAGVDAGPAPTGTLVMERGMAQTLRRASEVPPPRASAAPAAAGERRSWSALTVAAVVIVVMAAAFGVGAWAARALGR